MRSNFIRLYKLTSTNH